MGWDIKVPETSCPYYLSRFIHYSCSNWINKTGNCNEEKCPVKVEVKGIGIDITNTIEIEEIDRYTMVKEGLKNA